MPKKIYDEIVSDAKFILTEVHLKHLEDSQSDKVQRSIRILHKNIPLLENQKRSGLLNKLKNTMFETQENELIEHKAKELLNATEQLKYCLKCRHTSKVLLDSSDVCSGCIYGTYIISIENGIESRSVDPLVVTVFGEPIHSLIYNRNTGETIATVINPNGLEQQFLLDTQTGDIFEI